MIVLPKTVIHLSSYKCLTKQWVRISLLNFQPRDIGLGQNGLGGYDINVVQIRFAEAATLLDTRMYRNGLKKISYSKCFQMQ